MNPLSSVEGIKRENVWAFLASSVFWARFELSMFMPTFFVPSGGVDRFYGPYFVVTFAASLVVLAFASLRPDGMLRVLSGRAGELLSIAASLVGGALAMGGSYLGSMPCVLAGAVLCGAGGMYSMLSWAQLYAADGTKSAAVLITGSLAAALLVEALVVFLDPFAAALFTISLPVVVLLVLLLIGKEAPGGARPLARTTLGDVGAPAAAPAAGEERRPASESALVGAFGAYHDFGGASAGAADADASASGASRALPRPFGIPAALFWAFLFFGVALGYLQCISVEASPTLDVLSAQSLALARGVMALAAFVALLVSPKAFYYLLLTGLLAGIAGFSVLSVFDGTGPLVEGLSCYLISLGIACVRILLWLYLVELALRDRRPIASTFGSGLFSLHAGLVGGYLGVAAALAAGGAVLSSVVGAIGYLVVVAVMLLFVSRSDLWALVRAVLFSGRDGAVAGVGREDAELAARRLAEVYGFTPRETEVARYLVKGRSRGRIAEALGVSENTVNTHVNHIYQKMDVHSYQDFLDLILNER